MGKFSAALGVNGKLNDFFHTKSQTTPWYRIDLGKSYNIDEVVIYNRKAAGELNRRLFSTDNLLGETELHSQPQDCQNINTLDNFHV